MELPALRPQRLHVLAEKRIQKLTGAGALVLEGDHELHGAREILVRLPDEWPVLLLDEAPEGLLSSR